MAYTIKIREHCIPLKVDRHDHISLPKRNFLNEVGKKQNIMSEPGAIYNKSRLEQFNSFEEMNEADAKEMATISPIEHLKNVTLHIKNMYAEELKRPMNKRIKFRD